MNSAKMNLSYYLPALVKLYGENGLNWDMYDNIYNDLREQRRMDGKEGQLVEANIYDIILSVKKDEGIGNWLIHYFNQVLEQLNQSLDDNGKNKLKNTLHSILTAADHKYLNFVGELSVLHQLINSKVFTLKDIEVPLPNGKTADFKLVNQAGKPVLAEIHNIHLNEDKVEDDYDALFKFLAKRRMDKIIEKKKGLPENFEINFIQVLWGSARSLYLYSKLFQAYKDQHSLIEPVAYITLSAPNNPKEFTHYFGRVSSLFKGNIDMSFMNEPLAE